MSQPYQNQSVPGYAGSYGNAYYSPQSPYGQAQAYSPSPFPQLGNQQPPAPFQPPSAGAGPALTFANFHTNTQGQVPPPAPSFPFSTAPFPPEVLKQFANATGSIPPPPPGFPLVPLPNLNFPPFPPLPQVQSNQPRPYSPSQQVGSDEGEDAYDPRFPQGIPPNSRPPTVARSQGNLQHNNVQTPAQLPVQPVTQLSNESEPSHRPDIAQLLPNLDGTFLSVQRQSDSGPSVPTPPQDTAMGNTISKLSEEQESVPMHAKSLDTISAAAQLSDAQAVAAGSNVDEPPPPDYNKMSVIELRNAAKSAISSLAPLNITFDDLVKEGINSDILSSLYSDLDMQARPPGPIEDDKGSNSSAAETIVKTSAPEAASAQPKSTASPNLERKDRIAQLLAARAGKAAPPQSNAVQGAQTAGKPANVSAQNVEMSGKANVAGKEMQGSNQLDGNLLSTSSLPSNAVKQSAIPSMLPGLGMMSTDSDVEATTTPAKRTREDQDSSQDSSRKRRNTGLSSRDDTEMEIDDSSQDASEGEVVESPRPAQPLPPKNEILAQTRSEDAQRPTPPPSKPFSPITTGKLTPEEIAEKARQLKAQFLQKRARQQALQESLAHSDAEVKTAETTLDEQRSRLQEMKLRISKIETDLEAARQEELQLAAQIQRSEEVLKQRTDYQKNMNEGLQALKVQQNPAPTSQSEARTAPVADGELHIQSAQDVPVAMAVDTPPQVDQSNLGPVSETAVIANAQQIQEQQVQVARISPALDQNEVANIESYEPLATLETPLDEAVEVIVDDSVPSNDTNNIESGEVSQVLTPAEDDVDEDAGSDGSASMHDSASDSSRDEGEFSTGEEDVTQPMDLDDDSDEYEPAEEPPESGELLEAQQEASQPLLDGIVPLGETDDIPTANEQANNAISEQSAISDVLQETGTQATSISAQPLRASSAEHDYRFYPRSAPATPKGRWNGQRSALKPLANNGVNRSTSFSAYESPLTAYPSFRYNENFSEAAKGGFRSLTYSNTIDPRIPLCPTELAGDTCQDPTCEEQHFRHLGMTDDKILASMSSALEFTDKDTRDRYLLGLKGVIADLRARNVRDFEAVASALSEYRRKFVSGDS